VVWFASPLVRVSGAYTACRRHTRREGAVCLAPDCTACLIADGGHKHAR
jgi:hypothetical protein